MAKGRIRALRAIPGSTSLGAILRAFGSKDGGIVTAFSDSHLPEFRRFLGENDDLEVVSFSEVVRNVLMECGEDVLPAVQSGHKRAAIAYACRQLESASPFGACANFAGFHDALNETLDEIHLWGIDADDMSDMAAVASPRLGAKLRDMAEIDRAVSAVLDRLGRQLHTYQLKLSLDSTLELEGEADRILVFADAEEMPLRFLWLRWLAGQGFDVTVVFDRHATDAGIFQGADHALDLLGVEAEVRGDGNRLVRNLFTDTPHGGVPIVVSKVSAADPLAEIEWTLRGCLTALENEERVAIYIRDLESYAPLIEAAAKRFGVPVQMARRAPLMTNSFARLTLAALKFCGSDDVRTLSTILKSSYLGLTGNGQRELDAQLRECYKQKQGQWQVLQAWSDEHVETHPWLAALLGWRRRLIESPLSVAQWLEKIKEFNRDQALPWVKLENKGGEMDERDRRALNRMERLLADHGSIDNVTDKSTLELPGLIRLCERIWTDGDVSIPTSEIGVRVTADPKIIGDVDRLYVLGMLEGIFPRRRSEDPILTDGERAEINRLRPGQPQLQDSYAKARQERDEFYRVCATARRQIVFSYPLADDQRDNIPAFYLSEVARAVGESEVATHDYPRPELAPGIAECLAEADKRLREAIDGPRQAPLPLEIVSPTVQELIKRGPGEALRPEVLRDALQCSFQYLARHVLKIRVGRQSERWGTLRKLPQAALLLTNADLASAEQALIVALDAELDRLYAEVPEWEMQLLKSGGQRLIRDWLNREKRSREEWTKDVGSTRANVRLGDKGTRNVMPGDVKLDGVLAGLSRLENYNVAHIYGSAGADPKNLTETEKLYLGLHLLAIHEPGREGAIEIESASGKRTLMVLGRGASRQLASSVEDGLQVIDLATSDDPGLSKKEFFDDVKKALAEAVRRIQNGRVDAAKGDQCDWCDYGELCRRSRAFGEDESPFDDMDGGDV